MKIPKQTGKLIFPQLGAGSACGLGLGETEMPGQEGSYHNSPCRRRGCARRAAECLRQNHSWATLQFRDYCCVRLHHLSLLDGSCSQSQHTISTNFIFSNIVGLLAGWQPADRREVVSSVDTAQPSSLGTNVCTTFVAQEIQQGRREVITFGGTSYNLVGIIWPLWMERWSAQICVPHWSDRHPHNPWGLGWKMESTIKLR